MELKHMELKKRIKSFMWRAGAMAFLATASYFLKVGDLWKLDWHVLVNLALLAVAGLVVSEITKALNTKS